VRGFAEVYIAATDRKEFIMLGTIHAEAEGPEALTGWLEDAKPDVITLEFSKYGRDFRQTNGEYLRERLRETIREIGVETGDNHPGALEALSSYINLPYEFTAVSRYTQKTGVPFHLVDMDLFSHMKLRGIDTLIDRENVEAVLNVGTDNLISGTSSERVLAELFFRREIKTYRYTDEMFMRDRFMKERISLLMRHHGSGRYMHVCGWQHLPDPYNIYAPLKPIKVFMHDRAFCI
jgi:hypothetical protein